MSESMKEKFESQIQDALKGAFDMVIKTKSAEYQDAPQKIPHPSSVDALINSVSNTNAAISGGASIIPGPWGMLAVVPELTIVIRNQIALICDIGAAYGKKDLMMNKDIVMSIFATALGGSVGGLVAVHGSKVMIRRASLSVMQKIIALLGGKITQQALKAALSRWVPLAGAAAMALWTRHMTKSVGEKAKEILAKDLEVIDDGFADLELVKPIDPIPTPTPNTHSNEFYRVRAVVNLIKIDGKVEPSEKEALQNLLNNSSMSDNEKEDILEFLASKETNLLGMDIIEKSPDDAIALLSDLVALSKVDGNIHVTEKIYIKKIGKLLNFSENEIDEMLSS